MRYPLACPVFCLVSCLVLCLVGPVSAANWQFSEPLDLTNPNAEAHFHHLDGAGRQHVAANHEAVAVAWEDDHTGMPQAYLAIRPLNGPEFTRRYQLSDGEEAYEPALVSLGGQAWLVAWEQDGQLFARVVDAQGQGPRLKLAGKGARQVTLARSGDQVAAAWTEQQAGGQLIKVAILNIAARAPALTAPPVNVAPLSEHAFQGYPALAWTANGRLVVAWEDRRAGHTRLFHSWRDPGGSFAPSRQLNEHNAPPPGEATEDVGLGSGAMRVMLASDGKAKVRAIWLDKRSPASGYAVWGSLSEDGGASFGPNAIVQDDRGSAVPQWHAALAGGPAGFVAAWDDTREAWEPGSEPGDVILSSNQNGTWSSDLVVPVASGDGYQGSPAVALDTNGELHLLWISREDLQGPSRLFYTHASPVTP